MAVTNSKVHVLNGAFNGFGDVDGAYAACLRFVHRRGLYRKPLTKRHGVSELHALGVDLMLHQQGLDTTTPAGKAMFQMMGVFAEFERAMIRERVKAGLERARAQGKTLGRPTISASTDAAIRKALKKGDAGIRGCGH